MSKGISLTAPKSSSRRRDCFTSWVCRKPSTSRKQKIGNASRPMRRRIGSILSRPTGQFAAVPTPASMQEAPMWSISMVTQAMRLRAVPLSPQRRPVESVSGIVSSFFILYNNMGSKNGIQKRASHSLLRLSTSKSCMNLPKSAGQSAKIRPETLDRTEPE